MTYPIEVISIGEIDCYDDIIPAVDLLNSAQREFYFTVSPSRLRGASFRIMPRNAYGYYTEDIFEYLSDYKRTAQGYRPFLIGVIDGKLRSDRLGNLFGSHRAEQGYAVVTMHDLKCFTDSRLRYLCYYLIRYALSFVEPKIKSHEIPRNCFFDRKLNKLELVTSLNSGNICIDCRRKLTERLSEEEYTALKDMITIMRSPTQNSKASIAIITFVTEETIAVREGMERYGELRDTLGQTTARYFYEGRLPAKDGQFHTVVCTQTTKQGNRPVITAYTHITNEYKPALVVLLGIAGGIHKDINLCDVVFADTIIYYDSRKETDTGTKHRGQAYEIPKWLQPPLNHFFVMHHGEPAFLNASEKSIDKQFRVFKRPIGSGEAVLAGNLVEARKWLTAVNDKTLAVETEAAGCAEVFNEEQLQLGYQARGYLIVRGISDHADHEKDDAWRQVSADNAMIALSNFLAGVEPL